MTLPVQVHELGCQRGTFTLGPLSFQVPAGGRWAIVGPSGSGKTTLLRCLAGLERIQRGSITIGTQRVADERTQVAPDRRGLGLVFQDGALWSHLTALQHLQFAAPGLSRDGALAQLQRAHLGHLADRKPGAMSGGEAQRLGLLRALAPQPGVLLLDEPLRSVDVHQRDGLVLLLSTLAWEQGLTTILVTHDRDEALALATDLVVMHQGQLVEQGSATQLLHQPQTAFTAAFLAGAACLPTTAGPDGSLSTPLGSVARPAGSPGELQLVLLPGEAQATAAAPQLASAGHRVLSCLPSSDGFRVRVAVQDQLVVANSPTSLLPGSSVTLRLPPSPRLLPWTRNPIAGVSARP